MSFKPTLVLTVLALCIVWVSSYTKTVSLTSNYECSKTVYLSNSETLGIYYDASTSSVSGTCSVTIDYSDYSAEVCIKAKSLTHPCGVTIRFYKFDTSSFEDKTYNCEEADDIGNWCTTFSDARIELEPMLNSYRTSLELEVYSQGGSDLDDIVSSTLSTVWIIVGVIGGCIALAVIVGLIIACYCCKRAGSRGHVYGNQQPSTMMTTVTTPPAGAYPAQQAPPQMAYQPQGQGYPAGYQPGYQPVAYNAQAAPQQGYPGYQPQAGQDKNASAPPAPQMEMAPPPYPGN